MLLIAVPLLRDLRQERGLRRSSPVRSRRSALRGQGRTAAGGRLKRIRARDERGVRGPHFAGELSARRGVVVDPDAVRHGEEPVARHRRALPAGEAARRRRRAGGRDRDATEKGADRGVDRAGVRCWGRRVAVRRRARDGPEENRDEERGRPREGETAKRAHGGRGTLDQMRRRAKRQGSLRRKRPRRARKCREVLDRRPWPFARASRVFRRCRSRS
jgi:hypothetical protein